MSKPTIQILVCTNERPLESAKPCCAGRGALGVYHRFKDRVKELGLRNQVMVNRTGCLKHCSQGITVATWPRNDWFAAVTPDDVEEILVAAVENRDASCTRMPDIPWE